MKNIPNEEINQYIEKNPETALNCGIMARLKKIIYIIF